MATQEEMQAFVERSAPLLNDAEMKITKALKAVEACVTIPKEGYELQMAGFLQSNRLKFKTVAIGGQLAEALSQLLGVHEEYTAVAKAHDVDLPQVADGGGGR